MKVFISSTYEDLKGHREKAKTAIEISGNKFVGMETFGPHTEAPPKFCPEKVDECNAFILLVAYRYGYIPDEQEGLSITHKEYQEAIEKRLPIRVYLMDDKHPWPRALQDTGELGKKLESFRMELLKNHTCSFFTTPDNLHEQLVQDIKKFPEPPYFAHPYPLQENFTGRIEEREMLTDWLTRDPHPLLGIVAIGGMGKSALTWYWVEEDIRGKEEQPKKIMWWSYYDKESSFERFLRKAIEYFSGKEADWSKLQSIRDQMDYLYEILRQNRFLLVLDGLERVLRAYAGLGSPYKGDEIKEDERQEFRTCVDPNVGIFLQMLASGYPQTKTLFTSRLYPKELDGNEGCLRKDLTSMAPDDAVEFFHRQGVEGHRAEIESVCEPYGYHPLSIRLISGMIAKHRECPGDIEKWKEYDPLAKLIPKEHNILELAYNSIEPKKQKFVSKLAAFRMPMSYDAILIFNEFGSKSAFNEVLEELENRGLLFFDREHRRYDLHPIVRSYCYDRLRDKKGVHSQLRDYFASVPEPDRIESIDDLQPVIELYHHTVNSGRYYEAAELLRDRLTQQIYFQFGAYNQVVELMKALFPRGEKNPPAFEREDAQAWCFNTLANAYSLSGQPRHAVPLVEMAVAIGEKMGDKRNLAIGLGNLADDQLKIGDLESAESNLRREAKIFEEIDNRKDLDVPFSILGRILNYIGRYKESEEFLSKTVAISREFKSIQYEGVANAYRSLRALLMDDPKEALKCANNALEFANQFAKESSPVEADFCWAYWLIGASHLAKGDLEDAEKHLNEAIQRDRKINLVEIEAAILLEFAKLRRLQKRDEESLKLASEALEIANRCGHILQQADIHLFLAEFYKDAGDIEKAKEHAETAKLRSHQMIDLKTIDYITKPENTKWKYKPCYDKAVNFLSSLQA